MPRRLYPLLIALTFAACGDPAREDPPIASEPDDAAEDGQGTTAPVAPPPRDEWVVTAEGIGPVRVGTPLAELVPLLAEEPDSSAVQGGCSYVEVTGAPEGVGFMVEGGELARVDVLEGSTPTAEGARVGDAEAHVMELYPGAVRGPHKYTDGAYLVVIPGAPIDSISRIVFETDGERVTRYRAGLFPQVEYVEGCG